MAAPFPWFSDKAITRAPAAVASATVRSVDPSLTTTTSSTSGQLRAASTTCRTVPPSLYAGMMTTTSIIVTSFSYLFRLQSPHGLLHQIDYNLGGLLQLHILPEASVPSTDLHISRRQALGTDGDPNGEPN